MCRGPAGHRELPRGDGREEGCLAPWTPGQLHSGLVHTTGREKLKCESGLETGADLQGADPADISHPYFT